MKFTINKVTDKQAVVGYLNSLSENKIYTVEISQKRESRTLNQNRLYWLWLTCISDETGNEKEILHYEFGKMYLPKKSGNFFDEFVEKPVSTIALTTAQFTEYLNKIQVFVSSELGITLPNPEDLIFDRFYEKN